MKSFRLILILIVCIILVSGCDVGNTRIGDTALPKEDNATEINVEVWDNTSFFEDAAQKFENETGIKVNVMNIYNDFQSFQEDLSAGRERIQAELMAGKGVDIYVNTYIDYIEIGKSNHLCNLANWITADPDFSDNAYYMNIIKSGFDDGNLYSVPLFMMFSDLGSTIEVPELDGKSLNWEEFFNLTKGIKRSGILYGITDYELFRRRFGDRYGSFIDKEHKSHSLDSPEMVKLLEQCKQWSAEGLCIPYDTENTEMYENAFFVEFGGSDMFLLSNFRYDPSLDYPFYYDIPSDSGKNDKANKISPIDYICINAASQHQGTAWKFVKFLLREDIQSTGFFAPVNRKAAEAQISQRLNEIRRYFMLDIDTDQVADENIAILDAIDKVPNLFKNEIEQIINQEAQRYFRNEISAEEAAKNMAAKVTLYFKEQ